MIISNEEDYFELFSGCPAGSVAGEASTSYLASNRAPAIAFDYVPKARLIAILRHPVDRAFSQYLHLRQEGHENLAAFEDAWAAEDSRTARGWRPVWQYRKRGFYGRHLERWLEFFPREQLLILFWEDWRERPKETLDLVWRHLGVEPLYDPVITRENVSSRQPRWAWLHHRMVEDNALRRWAQRTLPLAVRDAITRSVTTLNLKPGPTLDLLLRASLAEVYYEDLKLVEKLSLRDLSAWRR